MKYFSWSSGPSGLRHLAQGGETCAGEERRAEEQPSPSATSMTASSYLLSGSKSPVIQDILRNFLSMLTVLTHT